MGKGQQHYPDWYHLRVEAVGPKPLTGKTVGESLGIRPAQAKPRRRLLTGVTPQKVYQAAAQQFSFAELPKGKGVGMNVGAKEMRSALDEMDVISFDMESLEEEENAQAQQDFKEMMENDKPLLSALWMGIQQMRSDDESSVQMEYPMFNLQTQGDFPYSSSEVEQTLWRWINYRSGQEVNRAKISLA